MAKKSKKVTKSLLAAALVTSAIVPVASANAAATNKVEEVVFIYGDKLVKLSVDEFAEAYALGDLDGTQKVEYIVNSDGKFYTLDAYAEAYALNGNDVDAAFKELAETNQEQTVTVEAGKIEGGKVVSDATPSNPELTVESVTAITDTKVKVTFTGEVDALTAANISIEGLAVTGVELAEDKKSAIITTALGETGATYTMKISGVKADGQEIAETTKTYTVPEAASLYAPKLTIKDEQTVIKADGKSQVLVTFELTDKDGVVVTDAGKVEVAFTSTFGNFGEKRVTVQNGVAQAIFTSEALTEAKTSLLTATVVEAENKNFINLKAERNILLDPNPDTGSVEEKIGATLTDVAAYQADRVVIYFNKDVNITDFTKKDSKGKSTYEVDPAELDLTVWTEVANHELRTDADPSVGTKTVDVKGLLPVPGNSKALYVLLDADALSPEILTDNANLKVKAVDKTGDLDVTGYKGTTLTDARVPAMLDVQRTDLKQIKVVFSEAVNINTANDEKNWVIDGTRLDNTAVWGIGATAEVGDFDTTTGVDSRHIVTITLGTKAGEQVYFKPGNHSVQGSNIGDWADLSDEGNNILNTQTLDFNIPADDTLPNATVEVQSPEQYIVNFNKEITNATAPVNAIKLQKRTVKADGTVEWVAETKQTIQVKQIGTSTQYKVEVIKDWTDASVYNTVSTNKNYYNDTYRLYIAKDTVKAAANGKGNEEISLVLGDAMTTPDVDSPKIAAYDAETMTVTMSEPVKFPTNGDGLKTLAQAQGDIPQPTADFIGKDKDGNFVTIPAKPIANTFTDAYDTEFDVIPSSPLTAGEWTLVVRSISDDVGNTAASAQFKFNVEKEVVPGVSKDFSVVWAYADTLYTDQNTGGLPAQEDTPVAGQGAQDAVYVKFNRPVKVTGKAENALATANYTLNGASLPTGTQIVGNIVGYDDKDAIIDSVTIVLPDGTLTDAETTVITVSEYLQSVDGEVLGKNGGQFKLSHNIHTTTALVTINEADAKANLAALEKALADESIREITVTGALPVGTEVKIDRLVDVDFDSLNPTAKVTVDTTEGGRMTLAGTIEKLTVNTPNADFVNNGTVTGTTTIKDVASSTFINNGTLADVVIEDTNGSGFVNNNINSAVGTVTIDTTAPVTLGGSITTVVLDDAANVTVAAGATVGTLTVNADGANITVAEGATVSALEKDATVDADTIGIVNDGTVVNKTGATSTSSPLTVDVASATTGDTTEVTFTFSANVTSSVSSVALTATSDTGSVVTATSTAATTSGDTVKLSFTTADLNATIKEKGKATFTVNRTENGTTVAYTVTVKYVNGRLVVDQPVKVTAL